MESLKCIEFPGGNKYLGFMKNNHFNGFCIIKYLNGDIFKGELKDGYKDGYGIYEFRESGDRYEGQFKNNNIDGYGKLISKNGDIYEGDFKIFIWMEL